MCGKHRGCESSDPPSGSDRDIPVWRGGVSAELSPDFRLQGVLSPEIPQNGRMRIETTARPEQNQGEHRNQKRARKSSIVGGPAGPKIEDWSSIGAWKATGKSSQYAGGMWGCPWC